MIRESESKKNTDNYLRFEIIQPDRSSK